MIVNLSGHSAGALPTLGPMQYPSSRIICCNECGTMAVELLAKQSGWRAWSEATDAFPTMEGHHCPAHVEQNQLVAMGLVFGVDRETAQRYGEW